MSIHQTRRALYGIAKALGDVQAVTSKKPNAIPKRIGRRIVGRILAGFMRGLFR